MFRDKTKLIGFIIGLILFSITVTSLTYAYYAWQSTNTNITFNVSDQSFYCETDIDSSINNLSPVLDYKDGVLHKFKVNNIANKDTTFSLTMNISSIDEVLKHESFKYKLMVDKTNGSNNCATGASGCEEVASGNFSNVHNGNNTLVPSINLPNNSRYEYYFFIYIDGNMNNPSGMQSASMSSTLGVCDIYVTFDTTVGETTVTPMYKKVIEGEEYGNLPTPTRNNAVVTYDYNGATSGNDVTTDTVSFTFNGWYKEQTFTTVVTSGTTVTSSVNHTIYPKWTKSKTLTLPTPSKEGYTFDGWYSNSGLTNKVGDAGAAYNPEKTVTLHAKFTPNSYTIHYNSVFGQRIDQMDSWERTYPERFTTIYDSSSDLYDVTVNGASGWELLYIPIDTVSGKSYTVTFDYMIPSAYTPLNGYTGIGYQATTKIADGHLTADSLAINYLPTTAVTTKTSASLNFTATGTSTYFVFNFGMVNDGTPVSIKLGNVVVMNTTDNVLVYEIPLANNNCSLDATTYANKTVNYGEVINTPNPTCTGYTFSGWVSSSGSGLGNNALTGTTNNPSTSWNGSNTKNTYFKNLRNTSGTVTLTAVWTAHTYTVNFYSNSLPSGYKAVEYIESTGTQYINTEYYPSQNTGIYTDFQFTDLTTVQRVYGVDHDSSTANISYSFYINGSSKWAYAYKDGVGNWVSTNINVDKNRHIWDFNTTSRKVTLDSTLYNSNVSGTITKTSIYPLYVMATNWNNSLQFRAKLKLYKFNIYENGNIVRKYIPCYRVSDNEAGLYDVINGIFYTNAGTGEFTVGDDLTNYDLLGTQSFTYGVSQNLNENTFDREGYIFTEWNTKANGSGTSYEDKQSVSNLTSEDNGVVNLYAQWESNNYIVHYTSNNNNCPLNVTTYANKTVDYEEVINIVNPTCTGYTFSGWSSSSSNGLGSSALTGTSSTLNTSWNGSNTKNTHFKHLRNNSGTVTLTAIWTPHTYTVNFYPNILPNGYRQLSYIEGTGTQYIDTGVTPSNTTDIEVTFMGPSNTSTNYQRVFGQPNNAPNTRYQLYLNNISATSWGMSIAGTTTIISMDTSSSFRTFKYVSGTGVYVDGSLVSSFDRTETNSYNIWLFRGYDRYSYVKMSSAKIWKNGSLVRNFIPCYRISDGAVGFYDIVTNSFYENAGTGEFVSDYTVSQSFTYGISQNLIENTFDREGYTFTGWNTKANGSGTSYEDKQSVINLTSEDNGIVNLYAQWESNNYTIHFASNSNCPLNATMYANKTVDYEEVINIANPTCTGYTFSGWSSSLSAGLGSNALTGTSSSSINVGWNGNNTKNTYFKRLATSGDVTLTALWTANTYTVSYDYHSSKKSTSLVSEYDGYYNMGNSNSLTTTTWKDLKGNNDGTIENGTWGSNYLSFNGTNSGVKLGEINNTYYTLELTFLLESRDGKTHIMGNWEQGGGGIYIDANGKLVGQFKINGSGKNVTSSQALSLNTVYNAAVTYDGSVIKLYLDGVLLGTTNAPGGITAPASGTPMALGGEPKPTGWDYQNFKGKIYYAAIYDTALNQAEIQSDVKKVVTYKSTYGSLQDNNIGITYFSGWYDAATNGNEITSSSIVNKTNNHTLYAYGAKSILREGTSGDATTSFLGTNINKGEIESITFANSISGHTVDNNTVFDVGIIQNKSVLLWYEDSDNDELYEVYIGSSGGIYAPSDSSYLFANLGSLQEFNNINYLNTSNVTNMSFMFYGDTVITNLDLNNFNTSKVTTMQSMFENCNKLINLNLDNFNTSIVTNFSYMFKNCSKLLNINLNSFNTSNVTKMNNMFQGCSSVRSLDLSSFDTSLVTDMNTMFHSDSKLSVIYVSSLWDVSKVTSSGNMFYGCNNLVGGNGTIYNGSYVTATRAVIDTSETPGYLTEKLAGDFLQLGNDGGATTNFLSTNILKGEIEKITFTDSISGHTVNNSNCWDVSLFKNGSVLAWSTDVDGDGYYEITIGQEEGVVANKNSAYLFANLSNLVEMSGMSNFDTSYVVTTNSMFYGDSSLSVLDLTYFNTSNVTNFYRMFGNCSSLTTLDFSSFNTSKVTLMNYMFDGCSNLIGLDLSSFDTSNVTNMEYMFRGCSKSLSLDLSSFDTSKVTNMDTMFHTNRKLNVIYVSSLWDVSNVTISGNMFYGCDMLVGGNGTAFNGSYITATRAVIDTSETPGYLTEKKEGDFLRVGTDGDATTNFLSTSILKGEIEKITFTDSISGHTVNNTDCWDVSYNHNGSVLAWSNDTDSDGYYEITIGQSGGVVASTNASYLFANLNNLEEMTGMSNFNTSNVVSMKYMFSGDSKLSSLDLSHFNTSKVTNMEAMFNNCGGLSNLNLSSFNTSKVTSMRYMFQSTGLAILDLSNFDTSKVTNMEAMFNYARKLYSIYVSSNLWNVSNVTSSANMFNSCNNLIGGNGTSYDGNHKDKSYAKIDTDEIPGYLTEKLEGNFLQVGNDGGATTNFLSTSILKGEIEKITFTDSISGHTVNNSDCWDVSYNKNGSVLAWTTDVDNDGYYEMTIGQSGGVKAVSNSSYLFANLTNLEEMSGMNYFDTSNVVTMKYLFSGDSKLSILDLSNFSTSKVTDMQYMFNNCNSLTSLDFNNFNTSNVTNMQYMFNNCNKLSSLNLNSFNTSKVTNMQYMFNSCNGLLSLVLLSFDTSNVINMRNMFYNCAKLTSLDLTSFDTSSVTDMNWMFGYSKKLVSIFASPNLWDVSNVTNSTLMFRDCNNLIGGNGTLYSINFTDKTYGRLDTVDTPGYLTEKNSNNYLMAGNDGGATSSFLNTGILKGEIEKITFTNSIDGHSVNNTNCWDVSHTNSGSVLAWTTDVDNDGYYEMTIGQDGGVKAIPNSSYLFSYLSNLEIIDGLSNFSTLNVVSMQYMFNGDNKLSTLDLSNFNTDKVIDMKYMFTNCSSLTSLNLSSFNTSKVTNMQDMFNNCNNLTSLNLSNFNTSNVTDMHFMFKSCSKLVNLNVENFDTSNVLDMNYMLGGNTELITLDLSSFNTSNVTNMQNMFWGDSKLKTIYVSNLWDISNVSNSQNTFSGCYSLVGGNGTQFNSSYASYTRAVIDAPGTPGYLTQAP